ncbi:GGDEF domain-containing protein|uniref:Diguanylate cyclase (GGDEF) domain-containing protein n=1 Tax=Dendrosporobacter quercicolus TaxID=146817 RepID=A0A1G9LUN1_9FIRM|nr:sensor domain-containing diguanylate cyclase [Dendrosporobacter quercicolus]NSL46838.1 GGDEF domain-containing protein [Dendrosporobacter quercicolus DSM 1736]SDL65792.1 diguanylate cyclase (GGDEF) domain-containing protein [Dendrosporobacter quercicolus]
MTDNLIYKSMLNLVTAAIPSAVLAIDTSGIVLQAHMSRHSPQKLRYLLGKNFFKILSIVLGEAIANTMLAAYLQTLNTGKPAELLKLKHTNIRGLCEYFNIHFSYDHSSNCIIVLIHNVTETALIEEEFTCMAEQYETVNRELCVSMSKLDFHLMDIDQAHKKIAALFRITSIVQKTVNEQEVLEEVLDGITREFGYHDVAILLLDGSTNELKLRASRGNANSTLRIPMGQGITGYAALHRELVHVDDVGVDSRYIGVNSNASQEVAVPLIVNEQVLGVLNIEVSRERMIQPYDLDLLRSISSQIAITIAHAKHVANVEQQAITDAMTGLYNYRYFRTLLRQEMKRAARYIRPLALFMIDIDFFKHYNDHNGHVMGDKVLSMVAALIKRVCRDTDHVFRYGGEEFVVLLPETTVNEAHAIAERVRENIYAASFPNSQSQPQGLLTVSIGIAGFPASAKADLELVDCADNALYMAKKTRNATCIYPGTKAL